MPIYAYSLYVIIDILITTYIDSISPDIINSIQCISILVFSPIVAYKLNFKKIYSIIYDIYFSDTNEEDSYSQNATVDPNKTKVKRQSERVYRDNQRFALSSINFF